MSFKILWSNTIFPPYPLWNMNHECDDNYKNKNENNFVIINKFWIIRCFRSLSVGHRFVVFVFNWLYGCIVFSKASFSLYFQSCVNQRNQNWSNNDNGSNSNRYNIRYKTNINNTHMTMTDRFKVTKTEESDVAPDYLLEESCTGKLLNDLSDNGKSLFCSDSFLPFCLPTFYYIFSSNNKRINLYTISLPPIHISPPTHNHRCMKVRVGERRGNSNN